MKKLSLLLLLISTFTFAQNYEVSTLRLGDFKIFMPKTEAEKLAKKKLILFDDYEKSNKVNVGAAQVEITLMQQYNGDGKADSMQIYYLKTKSPLYKTKSGIGVGNTKDNLIDAYRNYHNFEVSQYRDEKGNLEKKSYFTLSDNDAGTWLTFELENNIVVQISVGINEGC